MLRMTRAINPILAPPTRLVIRLRVSQGYNVQFSLCPHSSLSLLTYAQVSHDQSYDRLVSSLLPHLPSLWAIVLGCTLSEADPDYCRGGSYIYIYKGVGIALLILSHFSTITHENEIIWSH